MGGPPAKGHGAANTKAVAAMSKRENTTAPTGSLWKPGRGQFRSRSGAVSIDTEVAEKERKALTSNRALRRPRHRIPQCQARSCAQLLCSLWMTCLASTGRCSSGLRGSVTGAASTPSADASRPSRRTASIATRATGTGRWYGPTESASGAVNTANAGA